MGKVLFYFVRHGESEGNTKGVLSGHTDYPLTEKGREQARETAVLIPSDYAYVYSSDLLRCRQTTEAVNTKKLPVVFDRRLRERDFGTLTGKSWDELDVNGTLRKADVEQRYDYRPYGGESANGVETRLMACLNEIKQSVADGAKVLIVTSGGVIRMLHLRHKNEEHAHIPNASVHEFEL